MEHLTCVTCGVRFTAKTDAGMDNNESYMQAKNEHKEHFKSDWHRYNLKRKVLDLPAITAEAFTQKVLQQRAQQAEAQEFSGRCNLCNKMFASSNAFENHVKSKKHKELEQKTNIKTEIKNNLKVDKETKMSEDEGMSPQNKETLDQEEQGVKQKQENEDQEELSGSEGEWDDEGLGIEECLFCGKVSNTMEENITHMSVEHGFFIPDLDYVSDLEGLMTYLGQLVGELHLCLWCKALRFRDTQAVQQHMVDKGHCKLLHEGEAVVEFADYYDYRKSYPDYAGDNAVKDEEEEVQPAVLEHSDFQLVLPSGATVGHRSLARYFRQKLRADRQVILHHDSSARSRAIAHYKALGWTGTTGVAAEKKAKDIAFCHRLQARNYVHLGVRTNRLQKHFRDQVFGF